MSSDRPNTKKRILSAYVFFTLTNPQAALYHHNTFAHGAIDARAAVGKRLNAMGACHARAA